MRDDERQWHELTAEQREQRVLDNNGVPYQLLYTAADVQDLAASWPGFAPYTRGAYASMYRGRPWTIRQYAGFSSAAETNRFYHEALRSGQRGLSVAFDLPTHRGYDSDHVRAAGDVGKAGVAIDTVEDMRVLFDGIALDKVSVSMTMNGAVLPVLACFIVAAEERGVKPAILRGTVQNDILKEYIVRNTFIYPPVVGMRLAIDVIEYLRETMPKFNSISISGYHFQEAGADPALELALTLGNACAYLDAALARGLTVDSIAPRLSFFFAVGMRFLQEVAKLRAARRLWAQLLCKYKPCDPKSSVLRMHCQTSGYSLTQQQPHNNIVRTTIEALAAVLGGTQSLHTNAYDEAVSIPVAESARVARNTQLILQHETDITHTIDPLGGSYAIESLTRDVQRAAEKILTAIAARGGMLAAIADGYAKHKIEQCAVHKQALIDRGTEVVVGVNRFQHDEGVLAFRDIDTTALRTQQMRALRKIKRTRDNAAVKCALQRVRDAAAEAGTNLMPATVAAIRQRATVGEVSAALEDVFGRYQPEVTLTTTAGMYLDNYGDDEQVKAVRAQIAQFAQRVGRPPRILVAKLGQDGHDRGLHVIAVAFSNFGFDVDLAPLFQIPAEVVKHALENDVHVIGISTHTAGHKVLIPQLLEELRHTNIIVVAGGIIPPQDYEFLRQAGVREIFSPGTALPECAARVMRVLLHACG